MRPCPSRNDGPCRPLNWTPVAPICCAAPATAGATRDDLIKQTIFVVDYHSEIAPLIMGPLHAGTLRCTASSLVGVQALFATGYLMEIEAVARIPVA